MKLKLPLQNHVRYLVLSFGVFLALLVIVSCKKDADNKADTNVANGLAKANSLPETVDFNQHIRPLLSDRCYTCHGPDGNRRKSGYRLDKEEDAFLALKDRPDVFGIVPHNVEASEVVKRINSEDPNEIMPPPESNLSLSNFEKQLIAKWIDQGAQWKKHWSFIPVAKVEVPDIENRDWAKNDIDHFIARKLAEHGLQPSEKASKERLLRRVSFDLTGLPPSDEIKASYMADQSENALEKVVDQLFKLPAYGEHMATAWLDLSRYSDSHGYQDDLERIMWPWRDWVIKAFNENMPYDRFVTWQLAGDLLPNPTKEQILATAFNRNHKITQEGGVIHEEYRVEYVSDRTNTFGKALLGLTMECAKCHDHKYDPISQEDYYSMYAFFNSVPEKGRVDYEGVPEPNLKITDQDLKGILNFVNAEQFKGDDLRVMVMADSARKRPTHILNRGQYDAPGREVKINTPSALKTFGNQLSKDRLGLAKWLFDEEHPLTSRVTVNRVWQSFFGQGLVTTASDFGNQGSLPTHPELLDYLSKKLMDEEWNLQAIQKEIILSATYQQTSKVNEQLLESDPKNEWLSRGPRYRMTFEMIRDNVLAVSGLLNPEIGGPSVKPYQPEGLWAEKTSGIGLTKYVRDEGQALYRRSLYTFWKRTVPPPTMMTFDGASRDLCEVERQKTNTPLQALVMMNDPQILEASRVLAYQIVEKDANPDANISWAVQKILGRSPSTEEIEILSSYFESELARFNDSEEVYKAYLNVGQYPQKIVTAEAAAYMAMINTVFNLDEAITKT